MLTIGRFYVDPFRFKTDKDFMKRVHEACDVYRVHFDTRYGDWSYTAFSDQFIPVEDGRIVPEYSYTVKEGRIVFNKIRDEKV